MASEAEASCENDPNFAIICAFLEKFGEHCGIPAVDFVELQQMLENTQEVAPELANLHITLLRKSKRKVTVDRWERSLINMCHSYSSKDAWEIERFGYKKTRLAIKLRALKGLLEMQFDYNTKFKNEINKLTAEELRCQPLGRDKLGRAYWFQTDNSYQIRVYKEDTDEETWNLIAKDKEGLLSLITELTDGDSKLSSDSACNEDSNSLIEKPFIDTGQSDNSNGTVNDKDKVESECQEEPEAKKPKLDVETSEAIEEPKAEKPELDVETSEPKVDVETSEAIQEPATKKPELHVETSEAIEEPTVHITGVGSGEDCENSNYPIFSEEIEEPVMFFCGRGFGVECCMGNEQDQEEKEVPTAAATNIKLGTIIDSKTDAKVLSPTKESNKKSRWDQTEADVQNADAAIAVPKKMTFFFGPGSLNVKPNTVVSSENGSKETQKEENADTEVPSIETDPIIDNKDDGDKDEKNTSTDKEEVEIENNATKVPDLETKDEDETPAVPSETTEKAETIVEEEATKPTEDVPKSDIIDAEETKQPETKVNDEIVEKEKDEIVKEENDQIVKEVMDEILEKATKIEEPPEEIKKAPSIDETEKAEDQTANTPDEQVTEPTTTRKTRRTPQPEIKPIAKAKRGGKRNSKKLIEEKSDTADPPTPDDDSNNTIEATEEETKPKENISITSGLSFDYDPNSPATPLERNLRKRGRDAKDSAPETDETTEKKPKTKGKRPVDVKLRKIVEEKRQQEVGGDSTDEQESAETPTKKTKKNPKKKGSGANSSVTDSDNASPKSDAKKKNLNKNKRLLKNLGVNEEELATINESPVPVRKSRRIAQMKIKEEAIRGKMEEEDAATFGTKKKVDDKDFKVGKRKRIEDEVKPSTSPTIEKKKHKKKKKHKISIGWNTSSDDSSDSSGKEDDEEGSEYEYEERAEDESLQFKSDHEFSPESDIEGGEQQPLKRARTARKEDTGEEENDEEYPCQKCGKADHPEWILLCDKCDNGWHCSCLRPALFVIPEGDWYCPTCQHEALIQKLHEKVVEFDKMLVKKEMEDRRKERLAYVGISLNNVLPAKEKKDKISQNSSESERSSEPSESESHDSSDEEEPIYQLRQRRQAHSYKFQDYDDLINSALQEEPVAEVEKTHTVGRGKDIATIVNAAKEEEEKNGFEDLPPVVPKDTIEVRKKNVSYRRKPKRLNNLEVNSEDEADDSDEDFKGSSSAYSEEEDDDSDDSYIGRKGSKGVRRSTRARMKRFDDDDFINDDEDDDDSYDDAPAKKKKKKKKSYFYNSESESEISDVEWGSRSKKKKKSKAKYDSDDYARGRRTRGKKTSYLDTLGSDSEEEPLKTKAKKKSDDEYVIEEDVEKESEEEPESEEDKIDSEDEQLTIKRKKRIGVIDSDEEKDGNINNDKAANATKPTIDIMDKNVDELDEAELEKMMENEDYANRQLQLAALKIQQAKLSSQGVTIEKRPSLKLVRPLERSSNVKTTLPESIENENDELSEPPGLNLAMLSNAGARTTLGYPVPVVRLNNSVPGNYGPADSNPATSPSNSSPDSTPKKRRGRGKGKKTLAAEAAALATHSPIDSIKSSARPPSVPNIEIASPPQPFAQSQPAPSVITRMLQTTPGKGAFPMGRIRPKPFAMMPENEEEQPEPHTDDGHPPQPPYGAQYPPNYQPHVYHQRPPIHPYPEQQPPPINLSEGSTHPPPPPIVQYSGPPPPTKPPYFPNPNYNYDYAPPPPVMNTDDGIPPPVYESPGVYSEPYDNIDAGIEPNVKTIDDEPSGEFGGLVSYFSSQHEDDLDA